MQQDEAVNVLSFLITMWIFFTSFYYVIKGISSGRTIPFSDTITLFESVDHYEQQPPSVPPHSVTFDCCLDDTPPEAVQTKPKKKAKRNPARQAKAKPEPKPEPVRNHNGYTPLQQDCFDALKSLGIKGVRERKYIVSTTFNKNDPKTIQEFLTITMSRSC
jgi:hypothetical protein